MISSMLLFFFLFFFNEKIKLLLIHSLKWFLWIFDTWVICNLQFAIQIWVLAFLAVHSEYDQFLTQQIELTLRNANNAKRRKNNTDKMHQNTATRNERIHHKTAHFVREKCAFRLSWSPKYWTKNKNKILLYYYLKVYNSLCVCVCLRPIDLTEKWIFLWPMKIYPAAKKRHSLDFSSFHKTFDEKWHQSIDCNIWNL